MRRRIFVGGDAIAFLISKTIVVDKTKDYVVYITRSCDSDRRGTRDIYTGQAAIKFLESESVFIDEEKEYVVFHSVEQYWSARYDCIPVAA